MKKFLILFVLVFLVPFFYGCNKESDNKISIYISEIDISSLNNKNILEIINDKNLKEGIYNIKTKNNNYIFFNGKKNEYIDISSKLDDHTLTINCNTSFSSKNTKKLYVIAKRSSISSSNQNTYYSNILLKINNKDSSFIKSYYFKN